MPTFIEWSVLFAGAAAVFSLLSVVVGRLNYADDELSRQNRIENRILNRDCRVKYERPSKSQSTGFALMVEPVTDDEPEYRFQVDEVLVSENRGWHYLVNKVVHGFDGEVSVAMVSTRWDGMIGTWSPETPPDFTRIEEFDFEGRKMTYALREDENALVLTFQYADVERVSTAIDDLLDHIGSELASDLMDWDTNP